jgi:hypothetical protein
MKYIHLMIRQHSSKWWKNNYFLESEGWLSSLNESLLVILFAFGSQQPAIDPYHELDKTCRGTLTAFMYYAF